MARQEDGLALRSLSKCLCESQTKSDGGGRSRRAAPRTQTSQDEAAITPLKPVFKEAGLGSQVTQRGTKPKREQLKTAAGAGGQRHSRGGGALKSRAKQQGRAARTRTRTRTADDWPWCFLAHRLPFATISHL